MLTGRKHNKIMRPADGCLNWETSKKPERLDRYDMALKLPWCFYLLMKKPLGSLIPSLVSKVVQCNQ